MLYTHMHWNVPKYNIFDIRTCTWFFVLYCLLTIHLWLVSIPPGYPILNERYFTVLKALTSGYLKFRYQTAWYKVQFQTVATNPTGWLVTFSNLHWNVDITLLSRNAVARQQRQNVFPLFVRGFPLFELCYTILCFRYPTFQNYNWLGRFTLYGSTQVRWWLCFFVVLPSVSKGRHIYRCHQARMASSSSQRNREA